MTALSFHTFLIVLTGWIFAPRRTSTGTMVAAGVAASHHPAAFHRLSAKARWSLDQLSLIVFRRILLWLPEGTIGLAIDDTLAHKPGVKMLGAGMHHDAQRSTHKVKVVQWGHCWVIAAVVVRLPVCPDRAFSLPLFFRLNLNKNASKRWRKVDRTRPEFAVEMLHVLCGVHPRRYFHLVVDSAERPGTCWVRTLGGSNVPLGTSIRASSRHRPTVHQLRGISLLIVMRRRADHKKRLDKNGALVSSWSRRGGAHRGTAYRTFA